MNCRNQGKCGNVSVLFPNLNNYKLFFVTFSRRYQAFFEGHKVLQNAGF